MQRKPSAKGCLLQDTQHIAPLARFVDLYDYICGFIDYIYVQVKHVIVLTFIECS